MDRLDEIEERLANATPGPWSANGVERGDWLIETPESRDAGEYPAAEVRFRSDAELIAHAPTDLAALVAVVREVAALHRPDESRGTWDGYCRSCGKEWPCPTAAAVQELGGGS